MYSNTEMINNSDDITINNLRMRKYKRICSIAYTLYAIMFIIYAWAMGVTCEALYKNPFTTLIRTDAFFLKCCITFFGMMAVFKKSNSYSIVSMALQLGSLLLSLTINIGTDKSGGFCPNLSYTICFVAIGILIIKNNNMYAFLKEQYGFPHFNERQATQDFNKKQREIKDEFQQSYERRMKSSTNEMGDISSALTANGLSAEEGFNRGEMDSL